MSDPEDAPTESPCTAASAEAALTRDAFLDGRLTLWQPRNGYRAATDPVLLAAFVPARPGESALDLGCGVGTALLCLGRRVPDLALHGLELQPAYAELARRNAAENGIAATVHTGDIRRPPPELLARTFDHVLMNPPYFPDGATRARDAGRDRANREDAGTGIADWIDAGLRRTRPGGHLTLVHRTERLAEILAALAGRAGSTEILPLAGRRRHPAERILLRCRKSRKGPLKLLPALTLHAGDTHLRDGDDYTVEATRILRQMSKIMYSDLLQDARIGGRQG